MSSVLNTIPEALEDIKAGKVVIVVDDENRENEGDFVAAAEMVTPEMINFMVTHGRGLVCTPLPESRCEELDLHPMVGNNTDPMGTAFTVSVDLIGQGNTTGISALDRARTILALVNNETQPEDLARPGHIFPLKAKDGGVLRRTGHTEASVDLAEMAGLKPAGVIVEIMNEDGTMARLPQLLEIAKKFDIKIISIEDLVAHRVKHDSLVKKLFSREIETALGSLQMTAFKEHMNDHIHVAFSVGKWNIEDEVMVKVHSVSSSSFLNRLFSGKQGTLQRAIQMIKDEGRGVLLLVFKDQSYSDFMSYLEKVTKDEEYNRPSIDTRDFGIGAQILRELGISKIKLLSRHDRKRIGLIGYGLEIVENVHLD